MNATINAEYIRETNYKHSRLLQIIQDEYRLNPEQQKLVHDIILSSINSNEGKIFLGPPLSTGKTSLINLLLAKVNFD